ncbi:MAG: hypothetical protein ACTSRI_01435 [Promethearchaeota archaeon]
MLTDLLQNIYNRIAQLGMSIQGLKKSLDDLNKNIEEKIKNLTTKMGEFSQEIEITQDKHINTINDIGKSVTRELKNMSEGLGLDDFNTLFLKLEQFANLSEDILNQENVNMLLSEAIDSVKLMKQSLGKEKLIDIKE